MSDRDEQALAAVGNSLREQRDRAEAALVELRGVVAQVERGLYCSHATCGCAKHTLRKALAAGPIDLAARVEARIRAHAFREAADVCWSSAGPTGDEATLALHGAAHDLTKLAVEAEKAARS